jgi:hypothetical protein
MKMPEQRMVIIKVMELQLKMEMESDLFEVSSEPIEEGVLCTPWEPSFEYCRITA